MPKRPKTIIDELQRQRIIKTYTIPPEGYGALNMHLQEIQQAWYALHWDTTNVSKEKLERNLNSIRDNLGSAAYILGMDVFPD